MSVRIERLKHLARTSPDLPATIEFTATEVEVLVEHRRKHGPRKEVVPDLPTIGEAVFYLAKIGGYINQKGPPGATVLARGLERLAIFVEAFALFREQR